MSIHIANVPRAFIGENELVYLTVLNLGLKV